MLGVPLVSTSKGCDGIEHRGSICVADTPEDFACQMLEGIFSLNPSQASEIVKEKYSLTSNKIVLKNIIVNLCN